MSVDVRVRERVRKISVAFKNSLDAKSINLNSKFQGIQLDVILRAILTRCNNVITYKSRFKVCSHTGLSSLCVFFWFQISNITYPL